MSIFYETSPLLQEGTAGRFAAAPGATSGMSENFEASRDLQANTNQQSAIWTSLRDAYERRIEDIAAATGERLPNPMEPDQWSGEENQKSYKDSTGLDYKGDSATVDRIQRLLRMTGAQDHARMMAFEDRVDSMRAGAVPEVAAQLVSSGQMFDEQAQRYRLETEHAADVATRASTLGKIGNLAGGVAGAMEDPVNLITAPVGLARRAGASALRYILESAVKDAGVNAAFQGAADLSGVLKWRREMEAASGMEEQSGWDAAQRNMGYAAIGGGLLGGGGATIGHFSNRALARVSDAKLGKLYDSLVAEGARTSLEKTARTAFETSTEMDAHNPFSDAMRDLGAHREVLDKAEAAAHRGEIFELPANAPPVDATNPFGAFSRQFSELQKFRPEDLVTDAKAFQYKADTNAEGVSDRLKGVSEWNPWMSGKIMVYERATGEKVIVDGHQRLALAKRIDAENPRASIRLDGYMLREADGVAASDARTLAALKNISEGTGTAIDAAKVLRSHPELAPMLPPRSPLVRDATGLSRLSDDGFGMVVNEMVEPSHAAVVGKLVPDQKLQNAALAVLAKVNPPTLAQAESIIRQVMEAGFDEVKQIDMFGERFITESLIAERAKVLDLTIRRLKRDKATFGNLVRNEREISGAGNQLDAASNLTRKEQDEQLIHTITALANRKGYLSDALTAAARRAKGESRYDGAVKGFIRDAKAEIGRLGESGTADGGIRGAGDAPETHGLPEAERENLKAFDDPASEAAAKQADEIRASLEQHANGNELVTNGGNVPIRKSFFAWSGVPEKAVQANYDGLWRKYEKKALEKGEPLRFQSKEELQTHVEAVMARPDVMLPGTNKDSHMIVRLGRDDRAVVLEIKSSPQQHQIISAMVLDAKQLEQKLEKTRRRDGTPAILARTTKLKTWLLDHRLLTVSHDMGQPGKFIIPEDDFTNKAASPDGVEARIAPEEQMFDPLAGYDRPDIMDVEVPVGETVDAAGERAPHTMTVREVLDEIGGDEDFLKKMDRCLI